MRTTMQTIHQTILGNLNKLTSDMQRINSQISSGKQMSRVSDNPVNLVTALGLRTDLAELDQYRKNIQLGNGIITSSENALTQMKSLAINAKTLALQQVNAPISAQNRQSASVEANQLFSQAILLANTQVQGKFVFGGYRTTGYTATEPAPFIQGLIDGYRVNGTNIDTMDAWLTSTVTNTAIGAGDLAINGNAVGAINTAAAVNGLNMTKAFNARTAIEAADATVNVNLTTLYAGAVATAEGSNGGETMTQSINGISFDVVVPDGATAAQVATLTVAAINAVKDQTGVSARVGDTANGGDTSAVVLYNSSPGDETDIVVGALANTNADTGLAAGTYSVGAANNTGEISISSASSFTFTSPNDADDAILQELGLDGGDLGFADVAADGELIYGSRLASGDLEINGIAIGATSADSNSTIFADVSADAKATAINTLKSTTGVTAVVTPVYRQATIAVEAGTMNSGDLIINGVDIFDGSSTTNPDPGTVVAQDSDNVLLNAINNKSGTTGIVATRDSDGILTLAAIDGRNLHIRTTANGENLTHLNGAATDTPADKVYFGSLQLVSDLEMTIETATTGSAPNIYEPGLIAIGLDGGAGSSGITGDTADDGKITVTTIAKQDGNVRYAGDPDHDFAVKVGQNSTITVGKNGKTAVTDSGIFTALKGLENALKGEKFTTVTGIKEATSVTETLDSGDTGLELSDKTFVDGTISITVTDHSYYPPRDFVMAIPIDVSEDSLTSVAAKLHGIPGLTAGWNDNALTIETSDTSRYSFEFTDTSNFLALSGITAEEVQLQALDKSIDDLETVMENLTNHVSDFGARSNRIQLQGQIYDNLTLSSTEILSEKEDTDLVKALMEIRNKEIAYEAALSAAAKTMQLSLVNFL